MYPLLSGQLRQHHPRHLRGDRSATLHRKSNDAFRGADPNFDTAALGSRDYLAGLPASAKGTPPHG